MSYSNIKKKSLFSYLHIMSKKKIYSVIERIPKSIFQNDNIKILIINDYSKDKTFEEISKATTNFDYTFEVYNSTVNLGYGGVQKYAFQYAIDNEYDYTIMVHGDGQYAPEEIPNFISKFNDESLDAVFGSRMMSYKSALEGGMPFYKFLGNIFFITFVQNLILSSKISEFHSGYRSFKVESF